ncbi:hypothetical protein NSK_008811, partial [Nannochloropsis salina CCMP1776]
MGQIQGALTVLENAPLSKSGVPSWAEHDTFTATRTLFYNLSLLDRVLEEVSKDVLLPLESLLAQILNALLGCRRLPLSPALRFALCRAYSSFLRTSTTINVFAFSKDMHALLAPSPSPSLAPLPPLSRTGILEVVQVVFRWKLSSGQLSPSLVADLLPCLLQQLKVKEVNVRVACLGALAVAGAVTGKAEIYKVGMPRGLDTVSPPSLPSSLPPSYPPIHLSPPPT